MPVNTEPTRPETLRPYSSWVQPTPKEIRAVLALTEWNGGDFARHVGVQQQMAYRWMQEAEDGKPKFPIRYSAWAILCHEAGLGKIW